ncbi:hypothetical protein, partial [Corynebacterium humireducens]|uniref:hypothetical protein n=1 Tax=Corynebacterium humireducens TaxID=1223514 RepID=UPI001C3F1CBD
LQAAGDLASSETLLEEMRDAVERSSEIAGWGIPFAPTQGLVAIYLHQQDVSSAKAALERYLAAVDRYRKHEPVGGDTGVRRAHEWLAVIRSRE